MERKSTVEQQIAERARKFKEEPLTNLSQIITTEMLNKEFKQLNKNSVAGVDEQDWFEYSRKEVQRLPELLSEYKTGNYKARPVRRVYINPYWRAEVL
jgi:RNA-directed DNA polymerase